MPGLLSGVLPYLYSQGDRLKRNVNGLLSDPMGTMQQTAGGLLDSHRGQTNLLAQAFADPSQPFRVTDAGAMQQAAENMLAGPLGVAPAGMTAWHGSPYVFEKFDPKKIGTGEGGSAYGHGFYLSESPDVAKTYAKGKAPYKVDVPDKAVNKMLDWDTPIREQPKAVQNAMLKAGYSKDAFDMTGREIYEDIAWDLGGTQGKPLAAKLLNKSGIPGVKYVPQGGERNYVVFPGQEPLLTILERGGR